MKEKIKKKQIIIASFVWLFFTIFFVVSFKNLVWAVLFGLIYVLYFILTIKGYNPVINGFKVLWRGGIEDDGPGDYGITKKEINNYNKDKNDSG